MIGLILESKTKWKKMITFFMANGAAWVLHCSGNIQSVIFKNIDLISNLLKQRVLGDKDYASE